MAEEIKNIEGLGEDQGTQKDENKTYTQEELDALLQAETDRRVSQALKKAERKNAEKVKRNRGYTKRSIR